VSRLDEIKERSKTVQEHPEIKADCEEADWYRSDIPWLLAEIERLHILLEDLGNRENTREEYLFP